MKTIILLFLIFTASFNKLNAQIFSKIDSIKLTQHINTFDPVDWDINDYFFLGSDSGIAMIIGTGKLKKASKSYTTQFFVTNKTKKECLRVNMLGNSIIVLEVSFNTISQNYTTQFVNFKTTRGIYLGMPESGFLELSSNFPYQISTNNEGRKYKFTSKFGQLPYSSQFFFENERLVHFAFALDNFPN
jgi:hypothetical protein